MVLYTCGWIDSYSYLHSPIIYLKKKLKVNKYTPFIFLLILMLTSNHEFMIMNLMKTNDLYKEKLSVINS